MESAMPMPVGAWMHSACWSSMRYSEAAVTSVHAIPSLTCRRAPCET